MTSLSEFEQADPFASRHIGLAAADQQRMLDTLGYASLDDLLADAVPASIREKLALALPPAASEREVAAELRGLAARNQPLTTMIGLGYYGTITPPVIRRNVLESPAWYNRVHALPAGDQPGPARGAHQLPDPRRGPHRASGRRRVGAGRGDRGRGSDGARTHRSAKAGDTFVIDADALPQTIDVVRTRALALGLSVLVQDLAEPLPEGAFGLLVQYPGASGAIRTWPHWCAARTTAARSSSLPPTCSHSR